MKPRLRPPLSASGAEYGSPEFSVENPAKKGHDTVEANHHLGFEADHRNYDLCAAVLRHFGIALVALAG